MAAALQSIHFSSAISTKSGSRSRLTKQQGAAAMAQIDKLRPNGFPLRSRRRARLCGILSIAAAAVALLVLLGRAGQVPRPALGGWKLICG